MKEHELRTFLSVLQNRLKEKEGNLQTKLNIVARTSHDAAESEISKVRTQAHICELEFVIQELERILAG
ncbi:MAG TPA: hypothetical protein VK716_00685 [Terracidiphilus sp.]|nr:hypothetical protein [Terracidiphilus sp.]